MKKYSKIATYTLAMLVLCLALPACEIDDIPDPNNTTIEDIRENTTVGQLNNLVVGAESGMRNALGTYYDAVSVIGREIYRFSASDPRFTTDLLGSGSNVLNNNTFYITNPWSGRYRVIKNLNVLIDILSDNTMVAAGKLTEEQRQGYLGYAKTIKAHQLLLNLTMTYTNGIRVDVDDPDNLGPVLGRDEALAAIAGLLDEAAGHLEQAGDSFLFPLSSGFAGFDTPDTFLQFNRALAARVSVYRGNWEEALTNLEASFFDLNGDFDTGVYYVFGTGAGDQLNPLFYPQNAAGEVRVAHPTFITDATPGDDRLSKVSERARAATQRGLSGDYDVFVYKNNTAPVPIIRNEELILIYAEANIQTGDLEEAARALDIIRTRHGLEPYAGPVTEEALIDELLYQRRYSLFFEGHRWIDVRRYDRLDELPIDREEDDVWELFPIPFAENV
ncbi:RagB/SusD family nutrient uptake outer membrane protein [Pontibacter actiniarum]|uniref:RagB/SusD family nutrient uptake outer membrane protein n=1 Tax=Pontibacter actiniarum TaxID=323450 RepID=A0A1X9YTU5_9BACT|nr:RagB/SusD family nutrient uptake outer membrane protein [Pontibacter actiniarum]ARS36262.1 RagB/SusD family nutrient uptake outer membrane protein [Pontibacter actiniarum]